MKNIILKEHTIVLLRNGRKHIEIPYSELFKVELVYKRPLGWIKSLIGSLILIIFLIVCISTLWSFIIEMIPEHIYGSFGLLTLICLFLFLIYFGLNSVRMHYHLRVNELELIETSSDIIAGWDQFTRYLKSKSLSELKIEYLEPKLD